ncbi:receptor-like protein 2 [Prunus avium]|uniref:Receptor-like protein 2 n=1 Tax=Prunus avium TaxID=42229 RepID=A0A6P5SPY6_PRUAV|nr:receptor-like protein 2 [Prunus avium]
MALVFFLVLLFSSIISPKVHACSQTERSSLLATFIHTLSSPPFNWSSSINCCHWSGISCNQDGWVTHLILPSKGIKGGFKLASLANLTHLTHINLSHNSLYGSLVQTELFLSLKSLEVLDLSHNLLSGKLPSSLPSSNILTVDLSSNHLHGAIPPTFFNGAWHLTSFNASNNAFSGSIPSSICLQHSSPLIRHLDVSSNNFNGIILPGLGDCSNLQVFRAHHNNITGLLPEDIYNATEVEEIALHFNSLYGAISDRIANLTNLAILDLSFNELSGVLPLQFGKLSKLSHVILEFNNLQGSLPPCLMNSTNLIEVRLGSNNLGGDISALNFSTLSQLRKLDLFRNNFIGNLPTSLYSCRSLQAIRLSSNNLQGQIQPEILSLKSLSFLSLAKTRLTNLTGAIKILMRCKTLRTLFLSGSFIGEGNLDDDGMVDHDGFQNLRVLGLSGCEITGPIPIWLLKLKNLQSLTLDHNRITGSIPSWLGTLPRLFHMRLHDNLISGEYPKQLCRLTSLVYQLPESQVDDDRYEFELPVISGSKENPSFLQRVVSFLPPMIDVSNNNMNGSIPTEIGQLMLLHTLNLSGNNFSGNIPTQISNQKNLEALDLSRNALSGNIPSSLASLHFLHDLNVSYNDLRGPIPTSTQLQSLNASAFEGNPKLCGAPVPNECGPIKGIDAADKKNNHDVDCGHQLPWFYISVVLGFIVGFWGVCGSLIIKRTWRHAYFRFTDNLQDRVYMMMTVSMNRMKRKLRG